ncbi:MAG: hypothetical protein LBP21_03355 [Synergistaceae bacterium]|nr:hypothetical protein [Synergistaceae bacterium]
MEKRIAGIVRWLERCLKACKAGALESALMDVECARADIERLRDDVWEKLEKRHSARKRGQWVEMPLKAILGAMVFVLTAATPVAFFQGDLPRERGEVTTLEWVTPDEKTLLVHLRKHLSDSNPFALIPQSEFEPEFESELKPELQLSRPRPAEGKRVTRPALKLEPKAAGDKGVKGVDTLNSAIPYDRIISLVQAGEKAMKTDEPAIKIEK